VPLCKFLGKPVPDEPFPHINEKAALKEWIAITTRRSMFNALRNVVLVGGTLSAVAVGLYWNLK
jgi:Sulfotransferase domain